jgi:hypothetical protein
MQNDKGYDSLIYVCYDNDLWRDQWDWKRIRKLKKTPYERALLDMRIAMYNIGNKFNMVRDQDKAIRKAQKALLPFELREIEKIEKELEQKELLEPFNTKKKDKRWKVIYEHKDNDTNRTYISKQKRIKGKLVKKYLGKDWYAIRRKIKDKALFQVWGETWSGYGLTPLEMNTFHYLVGEVSNYPRKKDIRFRNPMLQKYIEQLGIKRIKLSNDRSCILSSHMNIEKKKRILDNARKAINKYLKDIKRKEERVLVEPIEDKQDKGYEEFKEPQPPKTIIVKKERVFVHCYA